MSRREAPEMVERVARAICASSNRDPDRIMPEFMGEKNVPEWWYDVDEAVAAITAMREATKPMSEAGWNASAKADKEWVSCTPRQLWAAMIDAALSDSRTGADQDEMEGA